MTFFDMRIGVESQARKIGVNLDVGLTLRIIDDTEWKVPHGPGRLGRC